MPAVLCILQRAVASVRCLRPKVFRKPAPPELFAGYGLDTRVRAMRFMARTDNVRELLQNPFAVLDRNHVERIMADAEMVLGAHGEHAGHTGKILCGFKRIAHGRRIV